MRDAGWTASSPGAEGQQRAERGRGDETKEGMSEFGGIERLNDVEGGHVYGFVCAEGKGTSGSGPKKPGEQSKGKRHDRRPMARAP